jgi:outer membrane protein assembly factor BamB
MLLRWLALAVCASSLTAAPEWTRFRGPNGTGVSVSKGLPVHFGKETNLLWRAALPPGYSSPVVGEKCIFLTVYEDTKLSTVCVNRADGQVAWKVLAGERQGKKLSVNTPVSPTAVTDGKNVFVFIEHAGLISYGEDGKERWRADLGKFNNPYGMGGSPILAGAFVILQADPDTDSYLLALDAKTGKQARNTAKSGLYAIKLGGSGNPTNKAIVWKAERSLPNIPSPLLYQDVLYVLKEGGILTSYDPKSGQVLKQGRVEGALDAYFASPVAADGKVFTVAKNGKMAVLKAAGQWEVLAVNDLDEETWATPAIDDGRLYVRTQSALYCFGVK